jgi:hypothetical protein
MAPGRDNPTFIPFPPGYHGRSPIARYRGKEKMRSVADLTCALDAVNVVNIHVENPMRNVGDHWSAVGRSVPWIRDTAATVTLPEARLLAGAGYRSPLQGKLVVIGGGGLIGPGPFEEAIESVFAQRPAAVVFWGVGHNVLYGVGLDDTSGWRNRVLMDDRTPLWPEYFSAARLVGVRDWDAGMPWVPCPSCLRPEMAAYATVEPDHDVAVINHYEHPIDASAAAAAGLSVARATNNTEELAPVLATIAAAPVVVSNSYHVLYWALLLGRAAVAYAPGNTRFDHFRWPVERASGEDWTAAVLRAKPSPDALTEARDATAAFSARVLTLAKGLGLAPESYSPEHLPVAAGPARRGA